MIRKPTVLILGAGASKPYRFPSGERLVRLIIDGLGDPSQELSRLLSPNLERLRILDIALTPDPVIAGTVLGLGDQEIERTQLLLGRKLQTHNCNGEEFLKNAPVIW